MMTRDEILGLEGKDLDAAVAEYVLGVCPHNLRLEADADGDYYYVCERCGESLVGLAYRAGLNVDNYSGRIASAWLVVEYMTTHGWSIELIDQRRDNQWLCEFVWVDSASEDAQDYLEYLAGKFTVLAKTVTVAICQAALISVLCKGKE